MRAGGGIAGYALLVLLAFCLVGLLALAVKPVVQQIGVKVSETLNPQQK